MWFDFYFNTAPNVVLKFVFHILSGADERRGVADKRGGGGGVVEGGWWCLNDKLSMQIAYFPAMNNIIEGLVMGGGVVV